MKFVHTPSFKLAVYAKGDENAEKLALVLPGRLDTKDYVHIRSHVDFLAVRGFYAVSFDPPGSWESSGSIENYTTTTYLQAINELIQHFGVKPTFLVGHSRGGAVAALAAGANDCVIGVVLIMSSYGEPSPPNPAEVKAGHHVSYRDLPPGRSKTKEQKRFDLPLLYFEDGKKYNSADVLQKFHKPKLLICGTKDEFFPPAVVRQNYDKLPEPKMFLELNTEHDYRLHADMIESVNHAIEKFLEKYFPA